MANDDIASKRSAEEIARLQCAFNDLVPKLDFVFALPARDEKDIRERWVQGLLAFAEFLEQMGPVVRFANQLFIPLAQELRDANFGIRSPNLIPAAPTRGNPTMIWIARAVVVRAIDTLRLSGHSRKSAAKWVAKKYLGLQHLITERVSYRADEGSEGPERRRNNDFETVMVSWCKGFDGDKVKNIKNPTAREIYSKGLDKLQAFAAKNPTKDEIEAEAHRLLRLALDLLDETGPSSE
jgi:hypothetical protein